MFGFKKKKDIDNLPLPKEITLETTTADNVKAKMDLIMTQLDSLKTQNDVLNQKIENMDKILKEIYALAKS
jgi:hypothetical protein